MTDRTTDSDRAVKLIRDALEDLRGMCSPEGARDAYRDIVDNAPAVLARLAAAEHERDSLRTENERLRKEPRDAFTDRVRLQADINKGLLTAAEQALTAMNGTLAVVEGEREELRRALLDEMDRREAAEARIEAARQALANTGYFAAKQVGSDIAPRIGEYADHMSSVAADLQAELDESRAALVALAAEDDPVKVARFRELFPNAVTLPVTETEGTDQ